MSEIVINGVSINDLKKSQGELRKGATEFISDTLGEVESLMTTLNDAEDIYAQETLAATIADKLDSVALVSGVTGVPYYLDYNEEWGASGEPYSNDINNIIEGTELGWAERRSAYPNLMALSTTLDNMEYESRMWHSSSVGC